MFPIYEIRERIASVWLFDVSPDPSSILLYLHSAENCSSAPGHNQISFKIPNHRRGWTYPLHNLSFASSFIPHKQGVACPLFSCPAKGNSQKKKHRTSSFFFLLLLSSSFRFSSPFELRFLFSLSLLFSI